jgi:carbonic anhydrase
MQTIHYPDDASGNIKGASVSVLFDTKAWHNYTEEEEETIDAFFESLVLEDLERFDENNNPRDAFSFEVFFSTVTQLVQDYNRWVYKGSLTMPPCTSPWFVQVFHRVLPIKEEYLEMI